MYKKILSCLIILLLCLSLISPVYAADAEIVGSFSDKFKLTTVDGSLFDIPIMNPGDVWESDLVIRNISDSKMQVKLLQVMNSIEDDLLFDILHVSISIDGVLFYEGPYNQIPASEWITIEKGKTCNFDITLSFPGDCGNEYQDKEFDSLWEFDAKLMEVEDTTIEDDTQTGVARTLYIGAMVCIGAFLAFVLLYKEKDDEKSKKRR